MKPTSEILFEYLRDMIYHPDKAKLDLEALDEEFVDVGKGLMFLFSCQSQCNAFAQSLARGDLSVPMPSSDNELAAPLKSLQASLRHLTWQTQQVAKGDYRQRVDFMGDFSDAFNQMVEQLTERQNKLENEIELSRNKTVALEQTNRLLSNITRHIPQQIIVVERGTRKILFLNDSAQAMIDVSEAYIETLLEKIDAHRKPNGRHHTELLYSNGNVSKYLSVTTYFIEWEESDAEAVVINDISVEKNQIMELENYAYRDSMTNLFNRFYGMMALNQWLDEKRDFTLIFADLDNLKFINDQYGHNDGDKYIINAAKHLQTFSRDTLVCRLGGDEFMLLVPDTLRGGALERMNDICRNLQNDKYLADKEYFYRVSFGAVSVDGNNKMPASDILSLADERMYEHKRSRKKHIMGEATANANYGH